MSPTLDHQITMSERGQDTLPMQAEEHAGLTPDSNGSNGTCRAPTRTMEWLDMEKQQRRLPASHTLMVQSLEADAKRREGSALCAGSQDCGHMRHDAHVVRRF